MGSTGFTPPPTLPTHNASMSDDAMDTDPPLSCPPTSALTWEELIGDGRGFTPPASPPAGDTEDVMDTAGSFLGHTGNIISQEGHQEITPQEVHLTSNTLKKGIFVCGTLRTTLTLSYIGGLVQASFSAIYAPDTARLVSEDTQFHVSSPTVEKKGEGKLFLIPFAGVGLMVHILRSFTKHKWNDFDHIQQRCCGLATRGHKH